MYVRESTQIGVAPSEGVHRSSREQANSKRFVPEDEVSSFAVQEQGWEGVQITQDAAYPAFAEGQVQLAGDEFNCRSFFPDALDTGRGPRGHGCGWAIRADDPERQIRIKRGTGGNCAAEIVLRWEGETTGSGEGDANEDGEDLADGRRE